MFLWGFLQSCTALLYSIFAAIYLAAKSKLVLITANIMIALVLLGSVGWCIAGSLYRFKHHGKVCSGDYFDNELYSEVAPFMWKSGRFLKVMLIGAWMLWGGIVLIAIVMALTKKFRDK